MIDNLTGKQVEQLFEALLVAYPTRDELRIMVRIEMEESLEAIADGVNQRVVIFNLITWAERSGRVNDLLAGALSKNPGNRTLAALAADWKAGTPKQASRLHHAPAPTGPAAIDVFLAYNRQDGEVMRAVEASLRAAGLAVWTHEGLEAGTPAWTAAIEEAVVQAAAMVVLLSPAAKASVWVENEVALAQRKHRRIFPILVDGDEDSAVPFRLSSVQWTDGRQGLGPAMQHVLPALQRYLERGPVAVDLAGWTFDQKEHPDRERDEPSVWQAQLTHIQQKCQHDLLAGVGELLKLRRSLAEDGQDASRRIEVEQLLESFQAMTESKDSPQHEQVLEKAVSRLMSSRTLSEDELEAVEYLLGRETLSRENADQSTKEAFRRLGNRTQELYPDLALDSVGGLYRRFAYSLAIRDLTVVTIQEWFEGKQPSHEEVKDRLHIFRYLLHDPRLAAIPFDARSQLYMRAAGESARYPWANPHHVDEIVRRLQWEFRIDARDFLGSPKFNPRRLPHYRLGNFPTLLHYPTYEDAEYGAYLMYEYLFAQQEQGLGVIDGLSGQDYAAAIASTFNPFSAISHPLQALDGTDQVERAWIRPFVQALGEEWIKLLAFNPLVWSGQSAQERSMLAGLLNFTAGTKEDIYYRLQRATNCLTSNLPARHFKDQQADREIIIGNLAQSIERHSQDIGVAPQPDLRRMETWLSLRPPNMTHTVVLAIMPPSADRQLDLLWANAARLLRRLRDHNVIVHLFVSQELPHGFSSLAVEEMSVPKYELARMFDDAFGYHQFGQARPDTSENSTEHCEIPSLKRLLDDESLDIAADLADALLTMAAGSPSRLFHITYDVLVNHFADIGDDSYETRIAPSELMRVLQAYKTQTP